MQKPKQPQPTLMGGMVNPMAAKYLLQTQQAHAAGQWQQAGVAAQACINATPDPKMRYTAKNLLAVSLLNLGQIEQAIGLWAELNASNPQDADVINNIGLGLTHLKQYDSAIQCFQGAHTLAPTRADVVMNLAFAHYQKRDYAQAAVCYQAATKIAPQLANAHFGLGWALQAEGRVGDAMQAYEQVLRLEPAHLLALDGLIFMNYSAYPYDAARQMTLARQYGDTVTQLATRSANQQDKSTAAKPKPHRPLRVGIVSADFCRHVVCRFLDSTLAAIDPAQRSALHLVAYSNQAIQDDFTQRLHARFDGWHRVDTLSDDQVVAQIKADQIDILIDLSGHTAGNRLPVFARKPAPVQVSWLGFWGTTGLAQIDYVLADPICVPPDEEDPFVEQVWRLPALRYCFALTEATAPVAPPPCLTHDHITFACYQATTKINDGVLALWAQILTASPQAQLRIQALDFAHAEATARFSERLTQAGIALDQVQLVAGMSTPDYLASYAEVDIVLDTFPYPGGTTTAEALWMGVPTLTLATQGMLGRQGEALLVNAGLADWIARSEDDYVAKAIHWAQADRAQRQALADLRSGLRAQVAASPVYDAKAFAAAWVAALEGMWDQACGA